MLHDITGSVKENCMNCKLCVLGHCCPSAMGGMADDESILWEDTDCLAYHWFQLEGLPERAASGRLIIAPGKLTRADLDFNWDVIGTAMVKLGARGGVDRIQEDIELFFEKSRPKGKKPCSSYFADIFCNNCSCSRQ